MVRRFEQWRDGFARRGKKPCVYKLSSLDDASTAEHLLKQEKLLFPCRLQFTMVPSGRGTMMPFRCMPPITH